MKNTLRITILFLICTLFLIYSCKKELSANEQATAIALNKPHTASIYLTDDQTPVFDSIFIDFKKLEVKVEDDSLSGGGWVGLDIRAGVYNILRFRNGLDTLFATGVLPTARIKQLRLTLGTNNSVMKDGRRFLLSLHDDDRQVVVNILNDDFDILSPGQLAFWIDFDASHSIQTDNSGQGNNNGYRLRSHISIFSRNHSGRIEGRVLPRAADALVMAINGNDTTMAVPDDDDGEFKIVGLNAGAYRIFIDGRNGYMDTLINNVIVRKGEDTHLPAISLHQ